MAPFTSQILIEGLKERVEAVTAQRKSTQRLCALITDTYSGDRLYLGTSVGNLLIYSLERLQGNGIREVITSSHNNTPGADRTTATLVDTKKNLTRKSIEQLGYLKDINSLVSLSGLRLFLLCDSILIR